MRACLQRVTHASVRVTNNLVGSCKQGFLILLGVGPQDTQQTAQAMWNKIYGLRVFNDAVGKMNLSLADINGEVLVVSQFTLYANARRGKRPSFVEAAGPQLGNELYEKFCECAAQDIPHVGRGIFGADMQVELVNDGPVTIWLDSTELGL
ncbi:MAG: D-aminoacyl-tRNA deacylase [Atopobium sp.]|uniref:D-aminoacyl-tRNA deacylase n=1 Tax=Atopobium sp. TaxID=1872650 RepID=UPI002A7556EA|nr:D-aminoacyl-tRNA deacylase [Atopobium sp.]MDY2788920.1 D-aminoacyl-tRNA deacylase [Atopobium sp.]